MKSWRQALPAAGLFHIQKIPVAQKREIVLSNCTPIIPVFGGDSVGVTPVPIPNTEVKPYSADDTAWETMWESRSPPEYFSAKAPADDRGLCFPRQGKIPGEKRDLCLKKRLTSASRFVINTARCRLHRRVKAGRKQSRSACKKSLTR